MYGASQHFTSFRYRVAALDEIRIRPKQLQRYPKYELEMSNHTGSTDTTRFSLEVCLFWVEWDRLIMSYFDNESLNKYKWFFFIDMLFYLWIDDHSNFIQFYHRFIVHQRPLNWNRYQLHKNLMVFDELSNDNEIAWNLNDPRFIGR
jgi:hypothetical protein